MSTISEQLADWVVSTGYGDIPAEIVNIARRNILDLIGVTLAGSKEPGAPIVKRYLEEVGGPQQCTVIGLPTRTSCMEAAFANGVLGHLLDYDDLVIPVVGAGGPHITVAILPAALAVAEKGKKNGSRVIESYILGCEIAYRIGLAVDPTHYNSGWHSTGTEGIFGAAVAACKLMDATREEIAHTLGIVSSEASGLRENFGTMTKPFHAGQACAKGIKAALLAKLGFTSAMTIFEGTNGFCNVMSKDPKPGNITSDLGEFLCMPKIRLKLYPCCAASHSTIYATMALVNEHDIPPGDVASITVTCDPQVTKALIYEHPVTALEGKFSAQFPIALVLSEKKVILEQFTDEKIKEPEIVALMQKVKVIPDPELKAKSVHNRAAIVEIALKNGTKVSKRCDYPPGTPLNPISDEDIMAKYRDCAGQVLTGEKTEESIKTIMNLELIDDVAKLIQPLAGN
ncbi:MmgE/PrpD family protein [Chloroflexota bacterium]